MKTKLRKLRDATAAKLGRKPEPETLQATPEQLSYRDPYDQTGGWHIKSESTTNRATDQPTRASTFTSARQTDRDNPHYSGKLLVQKSEEGGEGPQGRVGTIFDERVQIPTGHGGRMPLPVKIQDDRTKK